MKTVQDEMGIEGFYNGIAMFYIMTGIIATSAWLGHTVASGLGLEAGSLGHFLVDASVFSTSSQVQHAAFFWDIPQNVGDVLKHYAIDFVTLGAVRGAGLVGKLTGYDAKTGIEILKMLQSGGKLAAEGSAKWLTQMRAIAAAFQTYTSVGSAIFDDLLRFASSYTLLHTASVTTALLGISGDPGEFINLESLLTLALLHFRGKAQQPGKSLRAPKVKHETRQDMVGSLIAHRQSGMKVRTRAKRGLSKGFDVIEESTAKGKRGEHVIARYRPKPGKDFPTIRERIFVGAAQALGKFGAGDFAKFGGLGLVLGTELGGSGKSGSKKEANGSIKPTFKTELDRYNQQLAEYDSADAARRGRKELTAEQEKVLNDSNLQDLARQRAEFVTSRYQEHELVSAAKSDSPIAKHLEAHTGAIDLGSNIEFGKGQVFESPVDVIQFAEGLLAQAYRGEIQPGTEFSVKVNTPQGKVEALVRFNETGEMIDGIAEGTSKPGGRISLKVTFNQPIGKDGIVQISSEQQVIPGTRKTGGRDENVQIVNGEKSPTNTLYIIGGSYGPTGKFGLYTFFSGAYAPPMHDTAYWSKHAFATGDKKSFRVGPDNKVIILEGSNLDKMMNPSDPKVVLEQSIQKAGSKGKSKFSKWADRVVSEAKKIGDPKLVERAEAAKIEAESGTASDKKLQIELGKLNKEIKAAKATKAEAGKAKLKASSKFAPEDIEIIRELEAAGTVEPHFAGQLEGMLALPNAREIISQGLKSAQGNLNKNPVASYTAIQGMLFELSRVQNMGEAMGGLPKNVEAGEAVTVSFLGFDKRGNLKPMKAKVQNDVPLIEGHIWETKRYPRLAAGETPQSKNQLLKYQAAVEAGSYDSATIELSGNVAPEYIFLAKERAADVEILYSLILPDGREIVFPIHEARNGHRSLRRIQPPISNPLTELSPRPSKTSSPCSKTDPSLNNLA